MDIEKILSRVPRARGIFASLRQVKAVEDGIKSVVSAGPGSSLYDYQPGNGFRYNLLFTYLTGGPNIQPQSWLVTDLNSGRSNVFGPSGFLAAGYVQEKLGTSEADGAVLAEFLGHVMKRSAWNPKEYIVNVFSEEA